MCNPSIEKAPTPEALRAARHAGFAASITFCSAKEQEQLLKSYMVLDARREANVKKFVDMVSWGNS
jgi:hypothetical protein